MVKFLTGHNAALATPGCNSWEPAPYAVSHIYSEDFAHTSSYTPVCPGTLRLTCICLSPHTHIHHLALSLINGHVQVCPPSWSSFINEFVMQLFGIWNIFVQSDHITQSHVIVRSPHSPAKPSPYHAMSLNLSPHHTSTPGPSCDIV